MSVETRCRDDKNDRQPSGEAAAAIVENTRRRRSGGGARALATPSALPLRVAYQL